jgi:CheY-like chemotaxis protein
MPKGGVLTISAENTMDDAGEFVTITVHDTGIGMSDAVKARVFEPYFTTKQAGQGTGLGLAQVYGIVTQGGGTVRVESAANAGTSIILRLPRSHEPIAAAAAPQERVATEMLAGKRVLIVEDDDAVAGVVETLAREVKCQPTRASSAAAALAILSEGRRFDLIFSDIVMPGEMNGFELAQEIDRRYPGTPIILTTGFSGSADIGNRYPVLRKPYQPEEFERLLSSVLAAPTTTSA